VGLLYPTDKNDPIKNGFLEILRNLVSENKARIPG